MANKGRRSTYDERVQMVEAIKAGESPDRVAAVFGVGRESVFRYWRTYREFGLEGLKTKKTPGPSVKLTDAQIARLFAFLEGTIPQQHSFDFGLWTRKLVGELILKEFRVHLSDSAVGRLLRRMGMSPQRPLYRAYQQDAEKVRRWKEEEFPAIRKRADKEGALILFADEASVRTDYHAGTTWAPVGKTPVVEATGERKSVKMVSAISQTGHLRFKLHSGSMDRWAFIGFCKQITADIGRKIFLIVDGSSVHTAGEVREYVERNSDEIELFFLPPYSPDLNPDEWVNKNIKYDRVGRAVPQSEDGLKRLMLGALRRLQKRPDIVRGFFSDPALTYISTQRS